MGLTIKGAKPTSFWPGSLLLSAIILCAAQGNFAMVPPYPRDFLGCLKLLHLLGLPSWCQADLHGCLFPPVTLQQPYLCSCSVLELWL